MGLHHINKNQNYIFVMNHQSIMDIPIAFSLLLPLINRPLHLCMSHRFYDFFWWLTLPLGAIRIHMDYGGAKEQAYNNRQLLKGVKRLREGNNVLIYPEGNIYGGKEGVILRGKTGAVRMAIQAKKTMIPIGIRGSNKAYPFLLTTYNPFVTKKIPSIHVCIGKEINLEKYYQMDLHSYTQKNRMIIRDLTDKLMKDLSVLSGLPSFSAHTS